MDWACVCAAVIPCFNEAGVVGDVVREVRRTLPTVIVVDDGSTDQTAENAEAAGAKVLRHPVNRGKGAALSTGWKEANDCRFEWALTMDGDGQHAAHDIPALIDCAEKTGAALVIGNRMHDGTAMPWLRRHVNHWMTRRLSKIVGTPLDDSQCGFRLINLQAWSRLALTTRRFEIESELLVAFLSAKCKVKFVPIQAIYNSKPSNIRPLKDSCRWLRWWLGQRRVKLNG